MHEANFELDDATTRLEMITATITAIDLAISEGSSVVLDTALVFPVIALREISEKLSGLAQVIFDYEKSREATVV